MAMSYQSTAIGVGNIAGCIVGGLAFARSGVRGAASGALNAGTLFDCSDGRSVLAGHLGRRAEGDEGRWKGMR